MWYQGSYCVVPRHIIRVVCRHLSISTMASPCSNIPICPHTIFLKKTFFKGNNEFKYWSIKKTLNLLLECPKYRNYCKIELFENRNSMKTICIYVYTIFHQQISTLKLFKTSILAISLTGITAGSR